MEDGSSPGEDGEGRDTTNLAGFDWHKWLEDQYAFVARRNGDVLDDALEEQKRRFGLRPSFLPFCFSFAGLLQTKIVRAILIVLSAFYLYGTYENALLLQPSIGTEFRFTAVRAMDAAARPQVSHTTNMGLLLGSCRIEPLRVTVDGSTIVMSFPRAVEMNGWFYSLRNGTSAETPLDWLVEVRQAPGASLSKLLHEETISGHWRAPKPAQDDGVVTMERETKWIVWWRFVGNSVGWVLPATALAVIMAKRVLIAKRILIAWIVSLSIMLFSAAVAIAALGNWSYSYSFWRMALVHTAFIPCTVFSSLERYTALSLCVIGGCAIVLWIVEAAVAQIPSVFQVAAFALLLAAGIKFAAQQRRRLQHFTELIMADKRVFDAAWDAVTARCTREDGPVGPLLRLCDRVDGQPVQKGGRVGSCAPFHRYESNGQVCADTALGFAYEQQAAVESLDQLYAQAEGCAVLLRGKMQQLACLHGGLLRVGPRRESRQDDLDQYRKWPAEGDGARAVEAEAMHCVELKPKCRAIEKVLARYHGRVDLLLDVCRGSLAFDSLRQLVDCVRTLMHDPDVDVLRTRNTMTSIGRGPPTGFRAVVVNLRFRTAQARVLGIDGHVCELILLVKEVAQCLSQQAHADYLRLRTEGWGAARADFDSTRSYLAFFERLLSGERGRFKSLASTTSVDSTVDARRADSTIAFDNSLPRTRPSALPDEVQLVVDCVRSDDASRGMLTPLAQTQGLGPTGAPCSSMPIPPEDATSEASTKVAGAAPARPRPTPRHDGGAVAEAGEGSHRALNWVEEMVAGRGGEGGKGWRLRASRRASWEEKARQVRSTSLDQVVERGGLLLGLDRESIVLQEYRRRTLRLGGSLDQRREHLEKGVRGASVSAMLSSNISFDAALRKPIVPIIYVLIGLVSAGLSVQYLRAVSKVGVVDPSHLRFRAVTLRDEAAGPLTNSVFAGWGVVHDGCHLPLNNWTASEDWREYVAEVPTDLRPLSGVFFFTNEETPEQDPVAFEVAGLSEEGGWEVVGASRQVVSKSGTEWFADPRPLPLERQQRVDVPFGIPGYVSVRQVGTRVVAFCFALALLVLTLSRVHGAGFWACMTAGVCCVVAHTVDSVGRTLNNNYYGPFALAWLQTVMLVLGMAWFMWKRSRVLEMSFVYCVLGVLTDVVTEVVFKRDGGALFPDGLSTLGAMLIFLLLLLVGAWKRARAMRALQPDKVRYDRAWAALCADPAELEGIQRIRTLFASHPAGSSTTRPHQTLEPVETVACLLAKLERQREAFRELPDPPSDAFARTLSWGSQAARPHSNASARPPAELTAAAEDVEQGAGRKASGGRAESEGGEGVGLGLRRRSTLILELPGLRRVTRQKATSLALLYRQATGLHPMAQAKVECWATATRGLLPADCQGAQGDGGGMCRLSDLAPALDRQSSEQVDGDGHQQDIVGTASAGSAADVRWPKLKTMTRAVEKLVRSYHGEAWRLLDVCRFNIVFDHAHELAECVETVLKDPDVKVLAVKNRMTKEYNSALTAGYRDVNLNLVLVSQEAQRMGLAAHVWELQLVSRKVAELKSDGGHRRYVDARDARAE